MGGGTGMHPKLDNAVDLYIDGVVAGELRRTVDKCVADGFRQHTPGVGAGRDGLLARWQPLVDRYDRRYVQPLRGFVDGPAVLLHTFQSFGHREVERVVFDIFDTAPDDRITAHWSVTSSLTALLASGYSPIDGPHIIEDQDATDANKSLIAAYLDDRAAGEGRADRYVSREFVERDPVGNIYHRPTASGDSPPDAARVVRLLGAGNFVATLNTAPGYLQCDLYRVDQGLIAEHWGTKQSIDAAATARTAVHTRKRGPELGGRHQMPRFTPHDARPRNSRTPSSAATTPTSVRTPAAR